MNSPIVGYSIDRSGRIARVNRAWDEFALANGAPHLVGRQPLGTLLLDHISDRTSRLIYRYLLERVRATGSVAKFRCRCDSPDARRLMEISIYTGDDGLLEIRGQTVREEAREAVAVLDPTLPRSGELLTICSWCNRAEAWPDHWIGIEEAVAQLRLMEAESPPAITHGICHDCATVMLEVATDPALAESGRVEIGGRF